MRSEISFLKFHITLIKMSFVLLVLLIIPKIHGFTTYDCTRPTGNVTKISLVDIGQCDRIISHPVVINKRIQLLQVIDYHNIRYQSCRVSVTRMVAGCGDFSRAYFAPGAIATYHASVSREACLDAHKYGTFVFQGKHKAVDLTANSSKTFTFTLAGKSYPSGSCGYGDYSDQFGSWSYVHVEASITVTLHDGYTLTKPDENAIIIPTGSRCKLEEGHCFDEQLGYVFWNVPTVNPCHTSEYDLLYEGYSNKTFDNHNSNITEFNALYSIEDQGIRVALMVTNSRNLCGYKVYSTEHPRLFIVETDQTGPLLQHRSIIPQNLDPTLYANSKFVYLERHIKSEITKLYESVRISKCNLEKKVLRNAQSLAMLAPDEFAMNFMEAPGYMAYVGGEAIYIIECTKMIAKIRETDKCYKELPISVSNTSYFMTAKTHIMKSKGTEIPCTRITPSSYKIAGRWFDLTPHPVERTNPVVMSPIDDMKWVYTDISHFITDGIYTPEDLNRMREAYLFPLEKPSIDNIISRVVDGQNIDTNSIDFSNFLDDKALQKAAVGAFEYSWGKFLIFGQFTSGCLGIFVALRILKFIFDTIIHGITLHGIYGWSLFLIGALWDSMTTFLIQLRHNQNQRQQEQNQPENARLIPPEPQPEERIIPTAPPRLYPTLNETEAQSVV